MKSAHFLFLLFFLLMSCEYSSGVSLLSAPESMTAKNEKANAELFHEIFSVVMMHEPKDRGEFGSWVDSLNQGASLEGVYHGLIYALDYRVLEASSHSASQQAMELFIEEYSNLKAELPLKETSNVKGSSVFILKRLLGQAALEVLSSKSRNREALSKWYAHWVLRLCQRKVDFGIALRNNPDESFHFKWAMESNEDRIKWEVLNRIHRLLNAVEGNKI